MGLRCSSWTNRRPTSFPSTSSGKLADAFEGLPGRLREGIVITGTGKNFIAGPTSRQIKDIRTREEILVSAGPTTVFSTPSRPDPNRSIAAINGNWPGGEGGVAMACHYRVAAAEWISARPRSKSDSSPAPAYQRLAAADRPAECHDMITSGKPINPRSLRPYPGGRAGRSGRAGGVGRKSRPAVSFQDSWLEAGATRHRYERLPSAAEKKGPS